MFSGSVADLSVTKPGYHRSHVYSHIAMLIPRIAESIS
jgi:hypothetical protein